MFLKIPILFCILVSAPFNKVYAKNCKELLNTFGNKARVLKQLEANKFNTSRNFGDYKRSFPELESALNALDLKPGSHWIDLGAGQGVALAEYFAVYASSNSALTATGIVYRAEEFIANFIWPKDNVRMLENRLFEDIPNETIPSADLITDVYGVLSYTPDFDLNLAKALLLLKPGGALFIENGSIFEDPRTVFIDQKNTLHLSSFLKSIPNLKVTIVRSPDGLGQGLKVEPQENFEPTDIPELRLRALKTDTPPVRIYDVLKTKKH